MTDISLAHARVRTMTDADLAGLTAPPASPVYGAGYWLAGGATYTGDWTGKLGLWATDENGAWVEVEPHWGFPVTWTNCPGHTKWVPAHYTQDGTSQTPWATVTLPKDDGVLCPCYAPGNDGIYAVRVAFGALPDTGTKMVAHGIDIDWSADFPPTIVRAVAVDSSGQQAFTNGVPAGGVSWWVEGGDIACHTAADLTAFDGHVWIVARLSEP